MKGASRYMEILLVVFFDWVWSNWARPVLIGSLNSEDMISQVNIYVVDIVWILCDFYVWRSKLMVL